jgi:hypothetical protein
LTLFGHKKILYYDITIYQLGKVTTTEKFYLYSAEIGKKKNRMWK